MKLTLHPFELPLRHTFTIAYRSDSVQRTLVVELEQEGVRGFGEAAENAYFRAALEDIAAALERARPAVEAHRLVDPPAFWEQLQPVLGAAPFAQCALDMACHDLWGKLQGHPVWRLWGLTLDRLPATDYTIGIDSIEVMAAKLHEFSGWPIYKIKLGTANDLQIVRELRRHTDAVFRVDANCAWTAGETIRNSFALKELGVELIEQPLPPGDREGAAEAYRDSALPIIADESCQAEADVDQCRGRFHGINVKLEKCGGMTPARRMIARARRLGLRAMMGCMVESSVGISAIAQFLPLLDYVDMDGAVLLARDVARGVTIDHGRVTFPAENGCGVQLLA